MLIAIVDFKVAPKDRPQALDVLLSEVATVRAMDGCLNFRPFINPQNHTDVSILHEWHHKEGFELYLASPGFATIGAALQPLMIGPPQSRRFDATLIE